MSTTTKLPKGVKTNFTKDFVGAGIGKRRPFSPSTLNIITAIQAGLPVKKFDVLQGRLGVSKSVLAAKIGISKATLQRRLGKRQRLKAQESDRLVRYERLFDKAVEVLESSDSARHWLSSPQFGLGGAVPLDFAETEIGAREVEDLLGRIEHGVYS
jgi:putative toxin-antitoxin system antitoxin component (TIGR02293 family)